MPFRFLLLLVSVATLAAAEAPSLEERLRALESKVDALQKENAELRRALTAGQVEQSTAKPPAVANETAAPVHAERVGAADPLMPNGKEARVVIGGFTQAQAEFGGAGDARFAGTNDRIYLRRARLFLAGSFAEHFDFKVEGEFGAGSSAAGTGLKAQTNDTYLAWTRFPEATVRIGQLKPAYVAELLATEYKGPLIERSLGAERVGDSRQLGVEVGGEFWDKHAGYLVFVGNGNGGNSSANDNNKFLQSAHVFATVLDSKAAGRLTLGADALHSTDAALSKPGPGFDVVPGGAIDNLFTGTRDGWGVDATWHCGLLEVASELLRMRYRPTNAIPNPSFDAESWQLTAAYFLVPNQLQAAVRREHYDPNLTRSGDATNNWLVGLDYYIKGEDLKLMVDYLFGHAAGLPDSHGRLLTRFQIVY